jgi:hypothetical protein
MKDIYLVPCAICDGSAEGTFEVLGRSDLMSKAELPISKLHICVPCLSKLLDDIDESPGQAFERYGLADFNPEYYNEGSITPHWKAVEQQSELKGV